MGSETNGAWDLKRFEQMQEERFTMLEMILKDGFNKVADELKQTREQGHIPISVMERIDKVYTRIVGFLCTALVILTIWLTGVKYVAPHVFE